MKHLEVSDEIHNRIKQISKETGRSMKSVSEELLSKPDTLQQEILNMGYDFRDLTFHTRGNYTCRLGYQITRRRGVDYEGDTPLEAVQHAKRELLKELNKEL